MSNPSFLSVIVEIEPLLMRMMKQEIIEDTLFTIMNQLVVYCTAYTLFCRDNRLCILGYSSLGIHQLYPNENTDQIDFIPSLPELRTVVFANLERVFAILKTQISFEGGKSLLSMALSKSLTMCNRLQNLYCIQSRILSVHFNNSPSQYTQNYNAVMNCIFSAQKMNTIIDALVMSTFDSNLMQQACYLSRGIYMKTGDLSEFLPLLQTHYIADNFSRQHLLLPKQTTVDFKASCFDDNSAPKSLAFMCSVCLTLLTAPAEVKCPVCETPVKEP